MRKRRRVLPVLMLCLFSIAAYSQENWQGNAAVARSGEFDAPGLFAASNAFAENTKILVQNAQTGQRVQVTVTRRVPGTASVFLLLSEEAGKQIGLSGSQVIRVQASVFSTLGTDISDSLKEEAYSSDPDLNPPLSVTEHQLPPDENVPEVPVEAEEPQPPGEAAEVVAAEQLPAGEEEPAIAAEEPTAAEAEHPAGVAEAEEEVAAAAEPEVAEAPEEAAAEPPAAVEPTPEEKRLQELNDRIPQKQLYMPPRQQEVYALAPEPPAEEAEEEIAASEQSAEVKKETEAVTEPEVAEAEQEPEEPIEIEEGPPEVSMPGPQAVEKPLEVALPGPEAAEPEKPSPEGTRLPAPEEQPPLTMAPEEPPTSEIAEAAVAGEVGEQPAEEEEEAEPEVAMAEAQEEESTALSESLPSRSYFVQLGAYSTRNLAEKLAGNLTQSYSVTILPASSGGRRFYKVLVGPLNVDESGTLLYQFRARGFKDAFIQYVE